jgi:glycosyltransferase involved in cell wall biosynthesis
MLKLKKRKKLLKRRNPRVYLRIKNSDEPIVSVIIPVMNERKTIAQVIRNVYKVHSRTEVIVVVNGSTDGTQSLAKRMGAKVIVYKSPLGHDVGRSIGASKAKGKIILFVDGDFIIPTSELVPLIKAVEEGTDVALNSYMGPTDKIKVHNVIAAKHALNIALYRPDLKGASMTTIPHAINRKALDDIGIGNLAVPPKAHAIAVHKGLKVNNVHYINVGTRNPRRRRRELNKDPLEGLIIGDHLEAMSWLMAMTNIRGNHTDLTRLRDKLR